MCYHAMYPTLIYMFVKVGKGRKFIDFHICVGVTEQGVKLDKLIYMVEKLGVSSNKSNITQTLYAPFIANSLLWRSVKINPISTKIIYIIRTCMQLSVFKIGETLKSLKYFPKSKHAQMLLGQKCLIWKALDYLILFIVCQDSLIWTRQSKKNTPKCSWMNEPKCDKISYRQCARVLLKWRARL